MTHYWNATSRIALVGLIALLISTVAAAQVPLQVELVVIEEDEASSLPSNPITAVGPPFRAHDGTITAEVRLTTNSEFALWADGDVFLQYNSSTAIRRAGTPVYRSDAGGFVINPDVATALGNQQAIFTHNGVLAQRGQPAPGFTDPAVGTGHRVPLMLPDGTVYWASIVDATKAGTTTDTVLYRSTDATVGNIEIVLQSGDMVDGLTIKNGVNGVEMTYDISDNGLHHVHHLFVDSVSNANDEVIYLNGTVVLREGDPTGTGATWGSPASGPFQALLSVTAVATNDSGDWIAQVRDSDEQRTLLHNGSVLLRAADLVGDRPWFGVSEIALSNQGQFAQVFVSNGGNVLALGTVADPGSEFVVPLKTFGPDRTEISTDGDTVADYLLDQADGLVLLDDGSVYLGVRLEAVSDGALLDAIVRLPEPQGSAAAAICLGIVAVLRRRGPTLVTRDGVSA